MNSPRGFLLTNKLNYFTSLKLHVHGKLWAVRFPTPLPINFFTSTNFCR